MRDMAAVGKDHFGRSTADLVANNVDLLVAAELVVISLNDQYRADDVGQFVNHLPVAKCRLAPRIDPGTEYVIGLEEMMAFEF